MTILTPRGYSSARKPQSDRPVEEPKPAVAPPPPPPPAEPETPPAAAQEETGQQVKLRFPPQVVGVTCPNCGTPYPTQVFSIVDAGQDPILKAMMLSGQLNMAVCPRCNAGGPIGTPLLYHDPEHNLLGVYVPEQVPVQEQQKIIGDLSRRLMDGLPQEDRRGYMLTPTQYLTYQNLLEAVLETEGVTKEMIDGQRTRLQLIEQALIALQDPEGLRLLVQEHDAEMDDEFFGLLQAVAQSSASSRDEQSTKALADLQERLIELTTWGEGVQKQRAAIAQLSEGTTTTQLLDMILAADDRQIVNALVAAAKPLVNYEFYQQLTNRIDAAGRVGNEVEADRLNDLRKHILEYSERLDKLQRSTFEKASQALGEIMAENDVEQAVIKRAQLIDQNFLSVLASNLEQAQKQGATAAVNRLQEVWDAAVRLIQSAAPPEIRLINDLAIAEYPGETRRLLSENKALVNRDFVEALAALADEIEQEDDVELANKLRQIRSQAQLML